MSVYALALAKGLESAEVSNAAAAQTNYRRIEARTDGWYDIDDGGVAQKLGYASAITNYWARNTTIVTLATAGDTVRLNTTEKLEFRDTAIYIYSDADGYMTLNADVGINFGINATNQIKLVDGVLQPVTNNDVDLGAASYKFKDGYFAGNVTAATPTLGSHLTTKDYVDGLINGLDWQESVLDRYDPTSGLPAEVLGARYIATATANGWTINHIYEWNGTSWTDITPNEGYACRVEDEDKQYVFNGTNWVDFGTTVNHNNLSGLQGGTTNEYYHLTSAQSTLIGNITSSSTEINYLDGTLPTAGMVIFGNGTYLTGDATNLYWDNTNKKLGIGTNSLTTEVLTVDGAIVIGTTTGTVDGTIRWNGTNFQGYKSGGWVNLDVSDTYWSKSGTDLKPATAGDDVHLSDNEVLYLGTGKDGYFYSSADDVYLTNQTSDKDIIFNINDGGVITTILRLDADVSRVAIMGATALEVLNVNGAVNIGTTTNTNNGTIRWNGTNFQGYKTGWVNLDEIGTCTSVGLSMPANEFDVANSPVTGSGTLTVTWDNQTQNKVLASPNGSTGVPSFRALVAADIPDLSTVYTSDVITTRGDLIRGNASGLPERLALGTNGYVLTSNGTDAVWASISAAATDAGTAQGQMLFWYATGVKWTYAETSELIWDDTNKRLGIDQATPAATLHVGDGGSFGTTTGIAFGDSDTFIYESADDALCFYVGGSLKHTISSVFDIDIDVTLANTQKFYIGDSTTDGSWRFYIDGNGDLIFEKRSTTWQYAGKFSL